MIADGSSRTQSNKDPDNHINPDERSKEEVEQSISSDTGHLPRVCSMQTLRRVGGGTWTGWVCTNEVRSGAAEREIAEDAGG